MRLRHTDPAAPGYGRRRRGHGDLHTWHGTVHAAVTLAKAAPPTTKAAARREVAAAMREVADNLGNTPAIARASYVDPRVIESYLHGETLDASAIQRQHGPAVEQATARLLADS